METIRELLTRQGALDKQIKLDVSTILWKRTPSVQPFLTISSKLASEKALNTKVEWLNKNPLPMEVTYTGANEATIGVSLTFPNWTYMRLGDRWMNRRSGEIIRVSAKPASSAVTVTRDWGSAYGGGVLLVTGDVFTILGTSQEESDTNAEGRAILPTEDYNYTELWEDYAKTSLEAELMETVTGQDLRQQSIDDMKDAHLKKIELECIFGERAQTTIGTYYARTMRGIYRFIQTHVWSMNDISDFTRLGFDDFIMQINENTPDRKDRVFICSGFLKSRVSGWGMNTLVLNDQRTREFGMEISTYNGSTGGKIDIIEAPLFVGDYLSYLGIVLEYDRIAWKWLKNTELMLNVGEGYRNYRLDKIQTIGTMRFANENRMGLIKKA